jgi:class 3 adenylate cyclase/tetratricopeptide (TPR) repeat protein
MEAERRQISVLFADMVGFTAYSERSGEEAAFTLMQSLAKLMDDAVQEYGGSVQSFTGDGIMAVFGAPVAFEDAALRACKAAIAILEKAKSASGDFNAKHGVRPQLRIGLNSGVAVIGKVQGGSDSAVTVLGDTVNVAARLQAVAEPGSAVMSESMHRLTDGMVDVGFAGEHQIKGKSNAQKTYRLDGVRERTPFNAKIERGLTRYIGRDRELETLERGLDAMGTGIRVFDIVGEPGIGKSRLVHEFLRQVVKARRRVLTASCTPDGQQTPLRAFIEIVRAQFAVSPGDSDAVVARKLNSGLQGIGLRDEANLALLLNLLGLKPPEGRLEGLDGVLIGLRTRELLQSLTQAGSRLTPTIIVFEDLHWLDSASETLLAKMVGIDEPLQLLILHTRRPEYAPPWAGRTRVTRMSIEPLSARETARIAGARLGVDQIPEALAKLIAAKAEGNALFAEEIAAFLLERGIVRRSAVGLDFNSVAVATVLPESVQSLLSSRMDGLTAADRNLLHSAAVVGRRFDPNLVAAIGGANDAQEASLAAAEALGLIQRLEGSYDYAFKHALVRDALYSELLSGPRAATHLKVAEEIERRGGNRLGKIVEALAYHYAESPRSDKAFTYSAMAGDKCLDIYAIAEAEQYYRQALELFETQNSCADRLPVVKVVVRLLETLLLKGDYRDLGRVAAKFTPFIAEAGETPELVIVQYYRGFSLFGNLDFLAAHDLFQRALAIAERLRHVGARAYARCGLLQIRTVLGLDSLEAADRMKSELMQDSISLGDNYILNWSYFAVALDYMYRGLYVEARETAARLIVSGQDRNDPRAIGFANVIMGWINIFGDASEAATANADECLRAAVTPFDRLNGAMVRAVSHIVGGRAQQGLAELEELIPEFERLGFFYSTQHGARGAALAMCGRIVEGVDVLKLQISRLDSAGDRRLAAWARVTLAEVYIHILSRRESASTAILLKNFRAIIGAMIFGAPRARKLLLTAAAEKHISERGLLAARINFNLGLLSNMGKRRNEAEDYFIQARVGAETQGADSMLQKIDTALAELHRGQGDGSLS